MFEAETIMIICFDSKICQDIIKYYFNKLSKFIESKMFF